jgi:hypothetical protein
LREQVITPRLSGRGGGAPGRSRSGDIVQRPARRERGRAATARTQGGDGHLRRALVYFPQFVKLLFALALGVLLYMGYRAAASASFFQARTLDVSGVSR